MRFASQFDSPSCQIRVWGRQLVESLLRFHLHDGCGPPLRGGAKQSECQFEPTTAGLPILACFCDSKGAVGVQGRGTVITGRIEQGVIKVGEEIELVGINDTATKTVVTGAPLLLVPPRGPPFRHHPTPRRSTCIPDSCHLCTTRGARLMHEGRQTPAAQHACRHAGTRPAPVPTSPGQSLLTSHVGPGV